MNKVAILRSRSHLTALTDVKVYAVHIREILAFKQKLIAQTSALNISMKNFPQFLTLSANTDKLIEEVSNTLLSAVDSLHHEEVCYGVVRKKRDLIREQGLFPGVGRVLAYLTGTLTSDATAFINANTANLEKLKTSQLNTIHVVNHTVHIAKANAVRIQQLNQRIHALSVKMQGDHSELQAAQYIHTQFLNLSFMLETLLSKVTKLSTIWSAAAEGNVHPYLLHGTFYGHVEKSLDANTRRYKNLKPILRQSAKAYITACQTNVWLHISLPLLPKDPLPFYKVFLTPVAHGNDFDVLSTNASAISFSDDFVYEFTATELADAIRTAALVIVQPPRSKVELKNSCLYALLHQVSQTCTVRHLPVFEPLVAFENDYLVYSFPPGTQHFALLQCPHSKPEPTILTGSSILHVPTRCRVRLNNIVYVSTDYRGNYTFRYKQSLAGLNTVLPPLAKIEISHENLTDPFDISEDLASLHVASDILGTFSVPNESVFAVSMTVMSMTFALFIAVIILFLIICGPLRHCFKDPPVQIVQMTPIKPGDM